MTSVRKFATLLRSAPSSRVILCASRLRAVGRTPPNGNQNGSNVFPSTRSTMVRSESLVGLPWRPRPHQRTRAGLSRVTIKLSDCPCTFRRCVRARKNDIALDFGQIIKTRSDSRLSTDTRLITAHQAIDAWKVFPADDAAKQTPPRIHDSARDPAQGPITGRASRKLPALPELSGDQHFSICRLRTIHFSEKLQRGIASAHMRFDAPERQRRAFLFFQTGVNREVHSGPLRPGGFRRALKCRKKRRLLNHIITGNRSRRRQTSRITSTTYSMWLVCTRGEESPAATRSICACSAKISVPDFDRAVCRPRDKARSPAPHRVTALVEHVEEKRGRRG